MRIVILASTRRKVASWEGLCHHIHVRTIVLWVLVGVLCRPAWAGDLPDVKSRAAIVIDAETGAEIFSKNADEIRAIASTTKIFVAMAVREKGLDLDSWT